MKFLLFCNGSIGNTIMYSSVFLTLRKWFPDAQIDVVFDELGKQLYCADKHINKIYNFNRKKDGIKKQITLIGLFRKEHYDFSFHLRSGVRNELVALLGNVKQRVGYKLKGSFQFLTKKFEKQVGLHSSENYKYLIEKVFDRISEDFPFLPINGSFKTDVNSFIEKKFYFQDYVVMHPFGTTISQENWNLKLFYELIEKIKKPIFIFGTEDEISNFKKSEQTKVDILSNRDLGFVSEFIRGAKFFIGNDSSLFHIAECHNVKSFAFFQNDKENSTKWKPLKDTSTYFFVDEMKSNFVNKIAKIINEG